MGSCEQHGGNLRALGCRGTEQSTHKHQTGWHASSRTITGGNSRMSVREELVRTRDDEIVRRLADNDEPDVVAVAYEAGRRRLRSAVTNLVLLLDSVDVDVRLGALEALGEIGDDQAGQRITRMLQDDADRSLRDTAAWTLGLLRYRPAIERLVWMLSASEPTVRSCAAAALVAIGAKTALPAVRVQLAREVDPSVRGDLVAAASSLTPAGDPEREAARSQAATAMPKVRAPANDPGRFPPQVQLPPPISTHG
jgi:HEAT repeat protein